MFVDSILKTNRKFDTVKMTGLELIDKFGFEDEFHAPTKSYFADKDLFNIDTYKNSIKQTFKADYGDTNHSTYEYQNSSTYERTINEATKEIQNVIENHKKYLKQSVGLFSKSETKLEVKENIKFLDSVLLQLENLGDEFFNVNTSNNNSYEVPIFEYKEKELIYEVRVNDMIKVKNGEPLFLINVCQLNSIKLNHEYGKFRYEIYYIYPENDYVAHQMSLIQLEDGKTAMVSSSQHTQIFDSKEDAQNFVKMQLHKGLLEI